MILSNIAARQQFMRSFTGIFYQHSYRRRLVHLTTAFVFRFKKQTKAAGGKPNDTISAQYAHPRTRFLDHYYSLKQILLEH